MATLGVLVAVVQTLFLELEMVVLEHQGKETLAALGQVALTGLEAVAVVHLLLVQITQPQTQVALVEQELQAA